MSARVPGGVYRALLRLLPRDLRARHGEEMEALFREALERAREAGGARPLAAWLGALRDVFRRAPYEHWRRLGRGDERGGLSMSTLGSELRQALRGFLRRPGTAALVVAMVALGIAANTTVFTLADGLFLRPLPWRDPGQLVDLNETAPRWNLEFTGINYPDFAVWQRSQRTFQAMALYGAEDFNVSGAGGADRVKGEVITRDYPAVLGVSPVLGRGFTGEEDRPGGPPVAMISQSYWTDDFGRDPAVIGRTLRIDGVPHTIVGVLPDDASLDQAAQVWVPAAGDPADPNQNYNWDGVGRLRPGVTLGQARRDLLRVHAAVWADHDPQHDVSPRLTPLRDHFVGGFRTLAAVLATAVAVVLLIACVNVASLMLARASARRREFAVRLALGAGAGRLARQLLLENLLLALAGAIVGVLLAGVATRLLLTAVPDNLPTWLRFGMDLRVVGFAAAAAVAVALLSGLPPMAQARRTDLRAAQEAQGGRSTGSRGQRRTLSGLVVAEIALACVLLVGGGLLLRAYRNVENVDPGFRADRVLTFRVALPDARYPTDVARRELFTSAVARLRVLPGVESAGAITCPPLTCHWGRFYHVEGEPPPGPDQKAPVVLTRVATADYPRAMGLRLVRGRFFREGEGTDSAGVVVINEEFVREFYGDRDPIGTRIRGSDSSWITVIGVMHDVKHYGLDQPVRPGIYLPLHQVGVSSMALVLHTRIEPRQLIGPARRTIQAIDPELPLFETRTMTDALDRSLAVRRTSSWMLSVFSLVALALAAGGIYGVLSFVVGQRLHEIGIRVALGARRPQILRLVLRQGATLAAAGLAIGIAVALVASRPLATLLVGVRAFDPLTYGAVAAVLALTATAGALAPARRATRVEPQRVLRDG